MHCLNKSIDKMINCNLKNINSMNTFEQHILTTSLQTKPLPVAPARSGFELGAKHSWNNWYVRQRLFQSWNLTLTSCTLYLLQQLMKIEHVM